MPTRRDDLQGWFEAHPLAFAIYLASVIWLPGTALLFVTTRRWEPIVLLTVVCAAMVPWSYRRYADAVAELRRPAGDDHTR